ncbi:uncharacterized protein K452DRAFT_353417 [Aplosporella prunicola CBS 121167]|uniref:DNA 3'-5' helicase n=1 Tax=Aplosporella prunicola CBS 121167 TaxID=1176127 RepID=A0A6A6B0L6_9PEZI|nr:uncharacterized protein K452DRAFT_353417 [Aplosporella prunicola CBS 121167]KAF2137570.1 hypothetical protein K452DRAFT_353417 [Aplosporella prunicola CBS 121167]
MGVTSERRAASWGGMSLRTISLICLTFQNSALILIMHYSRMMPLVGPRRYFTSTAVFLNEVLKLSLSLTMALYEISASLPSSTPATTLFRSLSGAVFTGDSWKLAIPAMLYTLQNSLQYLAVSNLDAATFQVTYQLKILTTALFSVTLLGRSLSLRKWASLVLLMLGIAIVQMPMASGDTNNMDSLRDERIRLFWPRSIEELRGLGSETAKQLMRRTAGAMARRSATYEGIEEDVALQHPTPNASLGLMAVVVACVLSGLAGVYFEKVLKESHTPASLWVRNVQLSFYSLFPALFLGVVFLDGEEIAKFGFFVGYSWVVWAAIGMQALGGVVVALVVSYADNIAKNFATSISIIISCLASVWFFDFQISKHYLIGTSIVLFATYLYSSHDRNRPPPIKIAEYEKTIVGADAGYFDLTPSAEKMLKTPKIGGLSTSRPSTPSVERQTSVSDRIRYLDFGASLVGIDKRKIVSALTMSDDSVSALLADIDNCVRRPQEQEQQYGTTRSQYSHASRGFELAQPPSYSYMEAAVDNERGFASQGAFDAFDQQLLRESNGDLVEGRARVSLPPRRTQYSQHNSAPTMTARQKLAQFAYNPALPQPSSSPKTHGFPSSPAFKASQRLSTQSKFSRAVRLGRPQSMEEEDDYGWDLQDDDACLQPELIKAPPKPQPKRRNSLPTVRGIELVSTRELPDRFRSIFTFPAFNCMQSKCFDATYRTNNNFVVSSPTGSGKTVIFELAILRLVSEFGDREFKVVYQAPTKSLCSERQRDWQTKFNALGLNCAELTGDSDGAQLKAIQAASIIITTPEKWDSMTRKWRDHDRLMQMVKLFLIDEVHILNDERGATLEAVVSRMKSVGSDVRFVALSATVPNFLDIAKWLGKNSLNGDIPATTKQFGEEFRPVQLQKHVIGFQNPKDNEFSIDWALNNKLMEVIAEYSKNKPIMIFCFTRKSAATTAKALAKWWAESHPRERRWECPKKRVVVVERDLQGCTPSGVAYHHAGMDINDRQAVEDGFLKGNINVICCTSTLAVGINLPCHFVIIKNTVGYTSNGLKEYSDLEIMQMLGRAGRPQFDNDGVAVILTKNEKIMRYEKMVTGSEVLESQLHLNLVEHLNAEIGLGTVTNICSAKKWLASTFLYVRLQENPSRYKLGGDLRNQNLDDYLEHICNRDITLLKEHQLVEGDERIRLTEHGDIMARYYIRLGTMRHFLGMDRQARVSEIISALAGSEEFKNLQLRQGDRPFYNALNTSPSIKFPIPHNITQTPQKVSLIIQSVLGGADPPASYEKDNRSLSQYRTDTNLVFQHTNRLIRCIIDCALHEKDSVTARNALSLARSLKAQVWDDSPLQMKQIGSIGPVAVRKLVNAGVRTIEELEDTAPRRIETLLGKNPPYGTKLLQGLKSFPKLRLSLKQMKDAKGKNDDVVTVNLKVEFGFMNESSPSFYKGVAIHVCLLAETSDGHMVIFNRIPADRVGHDQEIFFAADITSLNQVVNCYVMCDGIAGTMRQATITPKIPHHLLSRLKPPMNISRRRSEGSKPDQTSSNTGADEFEYDGIADSDYDNALDAEKGDGFLDIDDIQDSGSGKTNQVATTKNDHEWQPQRLPNGKWKCNHPCKERSSCKHMCCKEGLDKPPKAPKNWKSTVLEKDTHTKQSTPAAKKQTTLTSSLELSSDVEQLDLTRAEPEHHKRPQKPSRELGLKSFGQGPRSSKLDRPSAARDPGIESSIRITHKKPIHNYKKDTQPELSFLPAKEKESTDDFEFDDDWLASLPLDEDIDLKNTHDPGQQDDEAFGEADSLLDEAMVGLADSQQMEELRDLEPGYPTQIEETTYGYGPGEKTELELSHKPAEQHVSKYAQHKTPEKSLFVTGNTSSSDACTNSDAPALLMQKRKETDALPLSEPPLKKSRLKHSQDDDVDTTSHNTEHHIEAASGNVDATSTLSPGYGEGIEPWVFEMLGPHFEFV